MLGRLLLAVALSAIACTTAAVSHGCDGPANDHVMLVDRLRCNGVRVDIGSRAVAASLRGFGTSLMLSGGGLRSEATVMSFAYDDADLGGDGRLIAQADAKRFASEASGHLYWRERVIAIYAGDDPAVTALLTRLLGTQLVGP